MSEPVQKSQSRGPLAKMTRGEWAIILILVAIHFTHMVDFVIIMPLGKTLMEELHISTDLFGTIVAAYALAAGIASLLASTVMDRFDRKSVLLTMYAGFGVSTLFCGLAPNYELLLASRVLAGVFGGLAAVAIMAVIADIFPAEKRGRAMGAISSSFGVATVLGLPLGLVLAKQFGRGMPFIVLAGLSAIVWVICYLRMPQVRGHLEVGKSTTLSELIKVAGNPSHARAYVFTFFVVLGTFMVASFIAPYLAGINGWSEDDLAILYFVGGIFTLAGMNFIGQMADRLPRLWLFRGFGLASLLLGILVTNLPPSSLFVAGLVMTAFMVCATGRFVPAQAMIIGVADPRFRGSFMCLNTAVQHLATGIAPLIAGFLMVKTEDGRLLGFPRVGLVAAAAAAVSLVLAGLIRSAPAQIPVAVKSEEASETESTEPIIEPVTV